MSADDKYPAQSGRRRFVKGVVGSAALASVGTATAAAINTTTNPVGVGGGTTTYMGIENIAGPAPRAMPQIPVTIDDEGYIKGRFPEWETKEVGGRTVQVADTMIAGRSYSAQWFQYCGVQDLPSLDPDREFDNYFRYAQDPPWQWQQQQVEPGNRINIEDLSNYETWAPEDGVGKPGLGKPAMGIWRSQGLAPSNRTPIQLIRSTRIEEMAQDDEWVGASTQQGVIAWLDKCTHFCCTPSGFQTSTFGVAENHVYCQCHQSIYDPFSIVEKTYVAKPRPQD